MKNPCRELRQLLGLNQSDFGRLIDRSMQSIRAYEKHPEDTPKDVVDALKSLAVERGLADYAVSISEGAWRVRRVIEPGERLISAAPVRQSLKPGHYNPKNQQWHDMLEVILESGDEHAINAVRPNLLIFHAWVGERKKDSRKRTQLG